MIIKKKNLSSEIGFCRFARELKTMSIDLFNIRSYKRLNGIYQETLVNLFILEYCLTNEVGLSQYDIAKNLKEIHSLEPVDLDLIIKRMAEIGYIEKDGIIRISSLGKEKLSSGQIKTEVAQLNMGIQNIHLQAVLGVIAFFAIVVQIIELIIKC